TILQYTQGDVREKSLRKIHRVIERRIGHFRLDHPEFGEVPSRFRFLGAKSRAKAIDLSKGGGGRFVVKLARLRQVSFLATKIIYFEQCGRSLAGCRREDRSVAEREAIVVEKIAHCLYHRVTHLQDRVLFLRTQP